MAARGKTRLGTAPARQDGAMRGKAGEARLGSATPVLNRRGMAAQARLGLADPDTAWQREARRAGRRGAGRDRAAGHGRQGTARPGVSWRGRGAAGLGTAGMAGMARQGAAWHELGEAGPGQGRHGSARSGRTLQGAAGPDVARQAWQDGTWRGRARQAWHGSAWRVERRARARAQHNKAGKGVAGVWSGQARLNGAWCDAARQGRQGLACRSPFR